MSTITDSKQDVIERVVCIEPQLRARGVRRLALFGSFARGDQDSDSDIDMLIEFESGQKTFDNFNAVYDLLEASLERRVELLTRESLSPHIGPHILQEAEDVVTSD